MRIVRGEFRKPSEERTRKFLSLIKKTDGCWIWQGRQVGPRNRDGIRCGQFDAFGVALIASRFSWLVHRGHIPENLCVLHHCDNPLCVNPGHLFLGTIKDNAVDASRKGRSNVRPAVAANRAEKMSRKFCKSGHEFTPENTYRYLLGTGTYARSCRACHREVERRRRRAFL